jgi:long-subunit fatty acid transport protein
MNKVGVFAAVLLFAWVGRVYAQNEIDALRYSQIFFGGSARSMGMAGSFGALGADPTAINTNPAGLARFSKGHFSLSLGGVKNNMSGQFSGKESMVTNTASPLQGLALVINAPRLNEFGWKSVQTSFAYNRIADFNATRYYEGKNYNSLLDVFASDGFLVPTSELFSNPRTRFGTYLAWETFALDDEMDMFFDTYYQPRLSAGDSLYHKKTIQSRGGISEYSFAISGNYNNSLYVGGSLNIQSIRFFENNRHHETVIDPQNFSLQSFDYLFNLESRGFGANLKLGMIFVPTDEFRIGVSYHTATMLRFKESFNADMTSVHDFGTIGLSNNSRPSGDFRYRLRNPGRWLLSMAYIFEKRLAMNADFEVVNYGNTAFRSSTNFAYQYDFINENLMVKELYRNVINLRLGVEYALTPEWFIRGGYARYARAFSNNHKNEAGANVFYAAGVGYRKNQFVIDLAYVNHRSRSEYYPFQMQGVDPNELLAVFNQRAHQLVLTLGFRFN